MKRDEFERHARLLIIGCAGCDEDPCIYCLVPSGDDTMSQLMKLVDQLIDSEPPRRHRTAPRREMWTAKQVADCLGLSSEASARATMSRRKVSSVKVGSDVTRYPADEVLAIREAKEAPRR